MATSADKIGRFLGDVEAAPGGLSGVLRDAAGDLPPMLSAALGVAAPLIGRKLHQLANLPADDIDRWIRQAQHVLSRFESDPAELTAGADHATG